MPKYRINYTMERWYQVEVEANSEEEAITKFHQGEHTDPELTGYGDVLQDSIEVEESND